MWKITTIHTFLHAFECEPELTFIVLQIGPDYATIAAYIFHPTCVEDCPHKCSNEWEYANDGTATGYETDRDLNLSCGNVEFYFQVFSQ